MAPEKEKTETTLKQKDSCSTAQGSIPCSAPFPPRKRLARRSASRNDTSVPLKLEAQSTDGKMRFKLNCSAEGSLETAQTFCKKALGTFQVASRYLTEILKLRHPITIQATLHDFCSSESTTGRGSMDTDKCQRMLGYGRPSASWVMNTDLIPKPVRHLVTFPQALIRQQALQPDPFVTDEMDIVMEFNTQYQDAFYFGPEVMAAAGLTSDLSTIESHQFDFTYLAIHELMHGFGMVTTWDRNVVDASPEIQAAVTRSLKRSSLTAETLLTPRLQMDFGENKISGLKSSTAFDYFLASPNIPTSTSTSTNAQPYQRLFPFVLQSIVPLFSGSASGRSSLGSMVEIQSTITGPPGSLVFQFPAHMQFPNLPAYAVLQSGPFASGSSIVHFDEEQYRNTEDFLMRRFIESGVSLMTKAEKVGGPLKPFGRHVVRMLGSIGYDLTPYVREVLESEQVSYSAAQAERMTRLGLREWITLCTTLAVVFMF